MEMTALKNILAYGFVIALAFVVTGGAASFVHAQAGAVDEFGDPINREYPIDYSGTRIIGGSDEYGDFGKSYKLLAPIDNIREVSTEGAGFGAYLERIFQFVIGAAGVLAVLMLVWGGVEYLLSEAFDTKKAAVSRMQAAVWGLLLAFGSWLILNTINPNFLNLGIMVPKIILRKVILDPTQDQQFLQKMTTAPNASENSFAQAHRASIDGVLDLKLLYATQEYQKASPENRRTLQTGVQKSFEDRCSKKGGATDASKIGGRTVCEIPLQSR